MRMLALCASARMAASLDMHMHAAALQQSCSSLGVQAPTRCQAQQRWVPFGRSVCQPSRGSCSARNKGNPCTRQRVAPLPYTPRSSKQPSLLQRRGPQVSPRDVAQHLPPARMRTRGALQSRFPAAQSRFPAAPGQQSHRGGLAPAKPLRPVMPHPCKSFTLVPQ